MDTYSERTADSAVFVVGGSDGPYATLAIPPGGWVLALVGGRPAFRHPPVTVTIARDGYVEWYAIGATQDGQHRTCLRAPFPRCRVTAGMQFTVGSIAATLEQVNDALFEAMEGYVRSVMERMGR